MAIACGERVAAGTAPLLRDRQSHQPELRQLLHELVWKAVLAVELFGERRHALFCELPNSAPDQLVLVTEVEVHGVARRSASAAISRTPQPVPPTWER